MAIPLAMPADVEAALVRPLTAIEESFIDQLIEQASALLRNVAPSVDAKIAQFATDPTTTRAIDPVVVAAVVAGIVKRYLANPKGLTATTDGTGPYSRSETYALRTDKGDRGVMEVTKEDIATLYPNRRRNRAGSIRTRAGLAPRPVGRYGDIPTISEAVSARVTYSPDLNEVLNDAEDPLGPVI